MNILELFYANMLNILIKKRKKKKKKSSYKNGIIIHLECTWVSYILQILWLTVCKMSDVIKKTLY